MEPGVAEDDRVLQPEACPSRSAWRVERVELRVGDLVARAYLGDRELARERAVEIDELVGLAGPIADLQAERHRWPTCATGGPRIPASVVPLSRRNALIGQNCSSLTRHCSALKDGSYFSCGWVGGGAERLQSSKGSVAFTNTVLLSASLCGLGRIVDGATWSAACGRRCHAHQ